MLHDAFHGWSVPKKEMTLLVFFCYPYMQKKLQCRIRYLAVVRSSSPMPYAAKAAGFTAVAVAVRIGEKVLAGGFPGGERGECPLYKGKKLNDEKDYRCCDCKLERRYRGY